MPDDIIREARELCERATPGPWYWDVIDAHKCICLKSASWKVMDFARYGMNSAAPRFLVDGIMERADTLLKSIPGKEHHRGFDNYIDHPDAAFIARSRALMPALLDLLAAKDAEIARLTAERDAIKQSCDGLCASHDNVYARLTAMAARAEKAEVERDAAVDERDTLMRRHAKQVEVIRHKIDDGGFSPDEQSLLDDLMLPRHFDRRGTEG